MSIKTAIIHLHEVPFQSHSLYIFHDSHQFGAKAGLKSHIILQHEHLLQFPLNHLRGATRNRKNHGLTRLLKQLKPPHNEVVFITVARVRLYLFPDVVVAEEAANLPFSQHAVWIWVFVPGQHVYTPGLQLRGVQGSVDDTSKFDVLELRLNIFILGYFISLLSPLLVISVLCAPSILCRSDFYINKS